MACGGAESDRRDSGATPVLAPADSLVLTSSSGTEVWFTLARAASSPEGQTCTERGLEIRNGERRLKVPLLYTGSAPVLVDDTTMEAVLWTHCQPGDRYRVSLRTGQPLRERR